MREDNLFHCHYTEKTTISLLIYSISWFSLLTDVLCNFFFFQKWADTVYVVLKTFFINILQCTINISLPCTWVKVPY